MKVLVLGGDGYLGWPTAMHLSSHGHEVVVVDNCLKRRLVKEEGVEFLYPVPSLEERSRLWQAYSGYEITAVLGDLNQWDFVSQLFECHTPDAVIHYAEQHSAPYSMLSRPAALLTLQNNLTVTAHIIFAVQKYCPETHIIKLGTMGEYGTPNIDIEEGWLEVEHNGRSDRFLYPRQASSLYHTTKIMDTDLLWFYVRVWQLRVTDLMQGPVYGIFTEENQKNELLLPFFSYDEIFGTVLNRFIVQAVANYPLTIYGKGGQTRGYLNLKDTLQCVRLALESPAGKGELRILNQFTETFSVNELAEKVQQAGEIFGLKVSIQNLKNPRKEQEEHYYNPIYRGFKELGLKPHFLNENVLIEMLKKAYKHKDNIASENIFKNIQWALPLSTASV